MHRKWPFAMCTAAQETNSTGGSVCLALAVKFQFPSAIQIGQFDKPTHTQANDKMSQTGEEAKTLELATTEN